jgi:hypothetical protein
MLFELVDFKLINTFSVSERNTLAVIRNGIPRKHINSRYRCYKNTIGRMIMIPVIYHDFVKLYDWIFIQSCGWSDYNEIPFRKMCEILRANRYLWFECLFFISQFVLTKMKSCFTRTFHVFVINKYCNFCVLM